MEYSLTTYQTFVLNIMILYGVDIVEGEDYGFALSLVIVIDQVIHDDNHNNN